MLRSVVVSSSILFAAGCFALPALAADLPLPETPEPLAPATLPLPAVSGPNGKIALFGGGLDSDFGDGEIVGGQGSFSIPLGERFGLQADGFGSLIDGDVVAGGAGHLFWRDPSVGLAGLYGGGAVNELADFSSVRAGIEGEAYFGRVSLEGLLGWEHLDFDIGGDDDNIFALADVALYATDDLRLWAGYRHWNDMHIGAFGAEYQLPMQWGGTSAALFAEGRVGEDDYVAGFGGVRLYFGAEPKSLIRRHREDDPRVRMEDEAGPFNVSPPSGTPTPPTQCIPPAIPDGSGGCFIPGGGGGA